MRSGFHPQRRLKRQHALGIDGTTSQDECMRSANLLRGPDIFLAIQNKSLINKPRGSSSTPLYGNLEKIRGVSQKRVLPLIFGELDWKTLFTVTLEVSSSDRKSTRLNSS